jgi:DNA polymerase I
MNIVNIDYINVRKDVLSLINENNILQLYELTKTKEEELRKIYDDKNIAKIKLMKSWFGTANRMDSDTIYHPVIILYYRDGNEKKIKIVKDFNPYIFAEKATDLSGIDDIRFTETNKTTIDGRRVLKIVYENPQSTYTIRKRLEENGIKHYMADIEFVRRYFIDRCKEDEKREYKKVFIDIETTTTNGFPKWEDPQEKIVVLTVGFKQNLVTFALMPDSDEESEEVIKEVKDNVIILKFKSETYMLKYFLYYLQRINGDILIGWNIKFDINYLLARIYYLLYDEKLEKEDMHRKLYNISFVFNNRVVSYNFVLQRTEENPVVFKGLNNYIVLDLLFMYKELTFSELSSYSLEFVAKNILNIPYGKERIGNFTEKWKNDFDNLIKYNINDVQLIMTLESKENIVDYFEEFRLLAHLPRISDALTRSKIIDNVLLMTFPDIVFRTKKDYSEEEGKIQGEYIYFNENIQGKIYENVVVLDFKSMYPNIIRSFNISPETLSLELQPNTVKLIIENENETPEKRIQVYYFIQTKKGILPTIVDNMITIKEKYEKLKKEAKDEKEKNYYEMRRFASKTVINAIYGVSVYSAFRLYDPRVGATITGTGRNLLKYVKKVLTDMGFEVLYGDTDSVFIYSPRPYDLNEILTKVNQKIKEYVEGLGGKNYLVMEFDKKLDRAVFFKKKRYYYIENGKVHFKGIDIIRTNTAPIVSENLRKVLENYITDSNIQQTFEDCLKNIKTENDLSKFFEPLKLEKSIPGNGTNSYKVNTKSVKAVKNGKNIFNFEYNVGQKFYGVYVKEDLFKIKNVEPLDKRYNIVALDNEHLDNENYNLVLRYLDREKYMEDFQRKLQNLGLDKLLTVQDGFQYHFDEEQ